MSRRILFQGGDCEMSNLREQMLVDLQLKGITPQTQRKYLREVSNFAKYFDKSAG